MPESLLSGIMLFFMRIFDTSFMTVRMLMIFRGRRVLAWLTAFAGSAIYILGVSKVLSDMQDWVKLLGYATGFASGMLLGMWIEERIAVGYTRFEVISTGRGSLIIECLRENGFAVTEVAGYGKNGAVTVLHSIVPRRRTADVEAVVLASDPDAFVVTQDLRRVQRGYWPS